ncbi:uncharacterized protein Z520_03594 [Fonsecaea multimorphosa CBS 102226]|uniref:Uncharacterized protein n=1 Tax=Fonsecaea multimorphosa CBS 102226 TaxID=1442371 RepID=A0A0D2K574_9EURO|nr:uncharacterized protein Z520_03594 [Fonsecaea multimorphosa CBS 102226]KIY00928.1 hypothetical protein Z520_03594 [Fonsecaea multimorphosa CBS 102226]OAL27513.1 hypothetical protein AYO22_03417 [Fonsecaea multimorphosa]
MDEPFRKRPRLSMFANRSSDPGLDEDLGTRRLRNDHLLKSRFESIFEKYSHDFSGIGDEIDMDTMSIVVNNGHVQSMEDETDPGGAYSTKGKSLLRAMTELQDGAQEYSNEGADEVIMSIEEIAENAAMAVDDQEMDPVDSDEELFVPIHARASYVTPPDARESHNTVQSGTVDSDHDSLFEGVQQPERSTSPDSLFQVQLQDSSNPKTTDSLLEFEIPHEEVDDDAILEKFGPRLGPEVLAIIRRTRSVAAQAHIEPAWRLPTNLVPSERPRSASKSKTPSVPLPNPRDQRTASPGAAKSLWKPPNRSTKRTACQAAVSRRTRAESADPLQDGFSDRQDEGEESTDSGQETKDTEDEQVVQMREGSCFYCSRQWACKAGVFRHWAKLAKNYDMGEIDDDDVHDLEYIRVYVSYNSRPARLPRLIVSDFKTLVELHEGAGLSFDEIAECRALRTHKTGLALNDVYDRYRTLSGLANDASREWSEAELCLLEELCQNPKRDVGTFVSHFKHRHQSEIGNKLAEIWLENLWCSVGKGPTASTQRTNTSPQAQGEHEGLPAHHVSVKVEPDSDEELFRRR